MVGISSLKRSSGLEDYSWTDLQLRRHPVRKGHCLSVCRNAGHFWYLAKNTDHHSAISPSSSSVNPVASRQAALVNNEPVNINNHSCFSRGYAESWRNKLLWLRSALPGLKPFALTKIQHSLYFPLTYIIPTGQLPFYALSRSIISKWKVISYDTYQGQGRCPHTWVWVRVYTPCLKFHLNSPICIKICCKSPQG